VFDLLFSGTLRTAGVIALIAAAIAAGVFSGFFRARRIQPGRFKWTTFRNEAIFATINLSITVWTLGPLNTFLREKGFILLQKGPAAWWVIALEYAAYWLFFDTWFYWFHRAMHKEPFYRWIHKIHHKSTSPNLLTTVSESPLESFINGFSQPAFLMVFALVVFPVHQATMVLIAPTAILMGLYVHSGHEFLPRWWNRSWATKWFITTTFHDQHHKYFNYNFGGYTPIWDYLCGTVRKKYEADFENPKGRQPKAAKAPVPVAAPANAPAAA
jgi:Delta7-sterol 5-desaturase